MDHLSLRGKALVENCVNWALNEWEYHRSVGRKVDIVVHDKHFKTSFSSHIKKEMDMWEYMASFEGVPYYIGALLGRDLKESDRPYTWFVVQIPAYNMIFIKAGDEVLIWRISYYDAAAICACAQENRAILDWRKESFIMAAQQNAHKALQICREAFLKDGRPATRSKWIKEVDVVMTPLINNVVNIK